MKEIIIKQLEKNKYDSHKQDLYKYYNLICDVEASSIDEIKKIHKISSIENKYTIIYDYFNYIEKKEYVDCTLNIYRVYKDEALLLDSLTKIMNKEKKISSSNYITTEVNTSFIHSSFINSGKYILKIMLLLIIIYIIYIIGNLSKQEASIIFIVLILAFTLINKLKQ